MPVSERMDIVAAAYAQRTRRFWTAIIFLLALLVMGIFWYYFRPVPVDYASEKEHFKYGSIGADSYDGIPLAVWRILPETFPEYLPGDGEDFLRAKLKRQNAEAAASNSNRTLNKTERVSFHVDGYAQFGFLFEANHELPIGFSRRRVYVDRVGLNCAVCHASTVRVENQQQAEQIYGRQSGDPVYIGEKEDYRVLVLGMPAHSMDLEAYFTFLFRCAEDSRFTSDVLLSAIDKAADAKRVPELSRIERLIIQRSIVSLRDTLLTRKKQLHYLALLPHSQGDIVSPRFGPGRVDTFSPYKSIQFGFPLDGTFGVSDYPSIWNQRPREGMHLHWDGNNQSVFERNISASLGAGTTPIALDMHRMLRTAAWIGSPAPKRDGSSTSGSTIIELNVDELKSPYPHKRELQIPNYPFAVDSVLANKGRQLYHAYCANCHGKNGDWTIALQGNEFNLGHVLDIKFIGTDPARLDSYTEELLTNQNQLGAGQWWRFRHFRKTMGYANAPLDGVWARAPYLHNGSVPTLYDLFSRACTPTDWALLGISGNTDLQTLAKNPTQVASIIAAARKLGLRPPLFYRGDDAYDPLHVGFRCDQARSQDGRPLYFYSTIVIEDGVIKPLLGNGHGGHMDVNAESESLGFGGHLTRDERWALIEYQKLLGSPVGGAP